jgi:acetyl-CoA acetyltransferase
MENVYVIGSYSTQFKRWPEKSIKDLTRMTYLGVLQDAGIEPRDIEFLWFSNTGWGHDVPPLADDPGKPGQMNVRGQTAFAPLVNENLFPVGVPCINVEGACASGSLAFHGAWKDILSGQARVSLALGAEKTFFPKHLELVLKSFSDGTDVEELPRLADQLGEICRECGKDWSTAGGHTIFMDIYAILGAWHMWKWGTTREQIAHVASKNHWHGSMNPLAQYQFEVPVAKILADYEVSWPLTRSMCAPLGDGAAAALLCSEDYLQTLPRAVKERAVKVLASSVAGGRRRGMLETGVSQIAARKAYRIAGIGPDQVDLAEVHDATAVGEILQTEALGFCAPGQGGNYAESGATRYDGKRPVNTSGGLESKGHPIGATGLSQINEIVTQLRREAKARQVKKADIGLIENGGGIVSVEEFCCAVTLLQKTNF